MAGDPAFQNALFVGRNRLVATPTDGIKAMLAGAHAVQMVSAILRHGPGYFMMMRDGLIRWMESKRFSSIDDGRGRIDGRMADAAILERANYIRTLQSWTPGS